MALAIVAAFAVLAAYLFGVHRGFSRGYLAAIFDLTIQEPENVEAEYLDRYGDRIEAGREGRN